MMGDICSGGILSDPRHLRVVFTPRGSGPPLLSPRNNIPDIFISLSLSLPPAIIAMAVEIQASQGHHVLHPTTYMTTTTIASGTCLAFTGCPNENVSYSFFLNTLHSAPSSTPGRGGRGEFGEGSGMAERKLANARAAQKMAKISEAPCHVLLQWEAWHWRRMERGRGERETEKREREERETEKGRERGGDQVVWNIGHLSLSLLSMLLLPSSFLLAMFNSSPPFVTHRRRRRMRFPRI